MTCDKNIFENQHEILAYKYYKTLKFIQYFHIIQHSIHFFKYQCTFQIYMCDECIMVDSR